MSVRSWSYAGKGSQFVGGHRVNDDRCPCALPGPNALAAVRPLHALPPGLYRIDQAPITPAWQ